MCFSHGCCLSSKGSEQSKPIVFAPSIEPTFVNVPQNNFVEPFVLNPGTWTVVIEAQGVLLVRFACRRADLQTPDILTGYGRESGDIFCNA